MWLIKSSAVIGVCLPLKSCRHSQNAIALGLPITELKEYFGDPVYEGNSDVILPEAIAINILNEKKRVFDGPIDMETDNTFSDVAQIISYDRDRIVYIYSFQRGDIIYSFVCPEKGDTFEFYYITGAEEQEDAA